MGLEQASSVKGCVSDCVLSVRADVAAFSSTNPIAFYYSRFLCRGKPGVSITDDCGQIHSLNIDVSPGALAVTVRIALFSDPLKYPGLNSGAFGIAVSLAHYVNHLIDERVGTIFNGIVPSCHKVRLAVSIRPKVRARQLVRGRRVIDSGAISYRLEYLRP